MRLLLPIAALLLPGCLLFSGGEDPPVACTMEFRMFNVVLLNAADAPVEGAGVDVIRAATGRSIRCEGTEQPGCVVPGDGSWEGRYTVMSDGVSVRPGGENFRVEATHEEARAEAILTFGHDGCHVRKLAGPDTLRLRR